MSPVREDFTFCSHKNGNKNKDANEKKNRNNNSEKINPKAPEKQLWRRDPLKVLPHNPAVQFSPYEKVSCDTLCFLHP